MPFVAWTDDRLDAAALASVRRTMGSQDRFEDLLREFLTSSAALLAQMERPADGGPAGIERAVHTLKSMARLLGATGLAEACRKVEFAAHATPALVPDDLVAQVRSEALVVQEAVRRLLA